MKIYSKTNCPKCDALKTYLAEANIPFEVEEINQNDMVKLQQVRDTITEGMGFPVAVFPDSVIGGDIEKIINKVHQTG